MDRGKFRILYTKHVSGRGIKDNYRRTLIPVTIPILRQTRRLQWTLVPVIRINSKYFLTRVREHS